MKALIIALLATAISASAQILPPQPSDCPTTLDVNIEEGVPIKPQNVPRGCNDFEVLVDEFELGLHFLRRTSH